MNAEALPENCPARCPAILVVDDKANNILAMQRLLHGLDAEILTANSGQRAIEIALGRPDIAVVLLDVRMPGMNGFETAETLRLNNSTRTIPIIFVTAESADADQVFRGYRANKRLRLDHV